MRQSLWICLLILLSTRTAWADPHNVVLAKLAGRQIGAEFYLTILQAALEKTRPAYGNYTASWSTMEMSSQRYFMEVRNPKGLANLLIWNCMIDAQKEPDLQTIPIPLDFGISSYWLIVTTPQQQALFQKVHTLADLKEIPLSMGFLSKGLMPDAWEKNLQLEDAPNYDLAARMLQANRFAGIVVVAPLASEYLSNLHKEGYHTFRIEPRLAIKQSASVCFITHKQNKALAKRLEAGLGQLIRSGEMSKLSQRYGGLENIRQLQLGQRQILELPAPPAMTKVLEPWQHWLFKP